MVKVSRCRPTTNALTIGRDIDVRRDDNRHNNAKGKEVWNEQGKGRERTEERSQSTDRPNIAEAEHKGEREREREEGESPDRGCSRPSSPTSNPS